ncbi:hypothetical protein [Streptomyces chilikensis]|uniref:Uncharacterized protein n=1 Tax=Streptomyces chilikensis TaxID=1194079 RepID=A0ABV3ERR3_9ACTN
MTGTPDFDPAEMRAAALYQALVRISPADPQTEGIDLRLTLRLGNGRPMGEVVFTADEVSELIARVESPACHAGADDDPGIDAEIDDLAQAGPDFTAAAAAFAALSAGYATRGPAPATADGLPEVTRAEVDDVMRGLTDLLGEQQ